MKDFRSKIKYFIVSNTFVVNHRKFIMQMKLIFERGVPLRIFISEKY